MKFFTSQTMSATIMMYAVDTIANDCFEQTEITQIIETITVGAFDRIVTDCFEQIEITK